MPRTNRSSHEGARARAGTHADETLKLFGPLIQAPDIPNSLFLPRLRTTLGDARRRLRLRGDIQWETDITSYANGHDHGRLTDHARRYATKFLKNRDDAERIVADMWSDTLTKRILDSSHVPLIHKVTFLKFRLNDSRSNRQTQIRREGSMIRDWEDNLTAPTVRDGRRTFARPYRVRFRALVLATIEDLKTPHWASQRRIDLVAHEFELKAYGVRPTRPIVISQLLARRRLERQLESCVQQFQSGSTEPLRRLTVAYYENERIGPSADDEQETNPNTNTWVFRLISTYQRKLADAQQGFVNALENRLRAQLDGDSEDVIAADFQYALEGARGSWWAGQSSKSDHVEGSTFGMQGRQDWNVTGSFELESNVRRSPWVQPRPWPSRPEQTRPPVWHVLYRNAPLRQRCKGKDECEFCAGTAPLPVS